MVSVTSMTRVSPDQGRRSFWLKNLHQWHWISSAICLVGMILFAATGITLNHAGLIEATPVVIEKQEQIPQLLTETLQPKPATDDQPLPAPVAEWIAGHLDVVVLGRPAEWSDGEVYVPLPRPGGDAWLAVNRKTGDVTFERTDRGWVSYFNDLHKGRNTGLAWSWFIDIFAVACLIFCITGFFLLQIHSRSRPATWPMAGLGVVVPLLLILLFIH